MRSPLTREVSPIRSGWQGVGVKHEETLLAVLASHGDALHRIAHVYAGGDGVPRRPQHRTHMATPERSAPELRRDDDRADGSHGQLVHVVRRLPVRDAVYIELERLRTMQRFRSNIRWYCRALSGGVEMNCRFGARLRATDPRPTQSPRK